MLTTAIAALVLNPAAPAITVKSVKTFDQFLVSALAAAPTGPRIAFATEDSKVRVFDTTKMQTVFALEGHPFAVTAIAFDATGTRLATADESARLYIWDMKTGKKIREFPRDLGHKRGISFVAFNPTGTRIASVGEDESIKIWNTAGGNPVGSIQGVGENFYGIGFIPSGGFVVGTLTDEFRLYNAQTYAVAAKMKTPGAAGINSIAVNGNGRLALVAGRDGKVRMFDPTARKQIGSGKFHEDWAVRVAIAPNSKVAASSGSDRQVVIWDTKTMKTIAKIPDTGNEGSPVAFTGDGRFFATTAGLGTLKIFAVNPPQK
ncbi:MAG: WD40 repeat domain-containing protein [Fimbriimonadaceae bacterium]|nr:WD40 repeat domain-containing protein [Fimbriimonadaceae bacterium]QYK55817.1 MAG: WD40 repeat domain-containing protein [Fimbriimonadaceae bacterium]